MTREISHHCLLHLFRPLSVTRTVPSIISLIIFQDRNWFVNAGCDLQQSFVCKANFAPPQSRPRDDRGDYGPCPGDWQTSGSDGTGHYCLKAFSQEKSWFEADAICKANFGARLTSIHDNYFNDRVSF